MTDSEPNWILQVDSLRWSQVFPDWLRAARRRENLTTRQLAALLKNPATGRPLSPQHINHLERGRARPSFDVMLQLARVFKTSFMEVDALVHGAVPGTRNYLQAFPHLADQVHIALDFATFAKFTNWELIVAVIHESMGDMPGYRLRRKSAREIITRFVVEHGLMPDETGSQGQQHGKEGETVSTSSTRLSDPKPKRR